MYKFTTYLKGLTQVSLRQWPAYTKRFLEIVRAK